MTGLQFVTLHKKKERCFSDVVLLDKEGSGGREKKKSYMLFQGSRIEMLKPTLNIRTFGNPREKYKKNYIKLLRIIKNNSGKQSKSLAYPERLKLCRDLNYRGPRPVYHVRFSTVGLTGERER